MIFQRKYNVLLASGTRINIPIVKRGVVDYAVGADWTPAAGDVKVSLDGGAAANVTNLPTAIAMGNTAYWQFVLTAAELTCKQCIVTVADSATKAVEDQAFLVETYGNASAMYPADIGASNTDLADVKAAIGTPTGASLSADVASIQSDTNDIQTRIPAALVSGRIDASVGAMAADVVTATAIAGDAITAAKVAADVTTEIQTGLATASSIAALPTAAGIADAVWDEAISGHSTAGSTGKALQDAGGAGTPPTAAEVADAVWDEALSGHATAGSAGKALTDVPSASGNATAVWSAGTRLLTAGTNIVLAKGTGVTGFNDPTAAATASAVRTELGVELGRVDVATSTRLAAGDYTAPDNGSIAAIEAQTNNLTFGVTGRVSVNVTHVNATEVTGNGQTGNEWGPL